MLWHVPVPGVLAIFAYFWHCCGQHWAVLWGPFWAFSRHGCHISGRWSFSYEILFIFTKKQKMQKAPQYCTQQSVNVSSDISI